MKRSKNLLVALLSVTMLLSSTGCTSEVKPTTITDDAVVVATDIEEEEYEMTDEGWEVGLEEGEEYIPDEETPLIGDPDTSTRTSTKTVTKKTRMSKKAKKTSSSTKTATKTSTNTSVSGNIQTTTSVRLEQEITTKYKKGSYYKRVTTVSTTTVTTTKITIPAGEVSIREIAPAAHENVLAAFEAKGYTVLVDPTARYTGEFSTRKKMITVTRIDGVVYHELGHFVAFMNHRCDETEEFKAIFAKEKSLYTASNKAYILSNSGEYFAESYKNYVEAPETLKSKRPLTYEYIKRMVEAL